MKHNAYKWLKTPEEQDFPAALSYLSLLYDARTVAACVKKLKRAPMTEFKAKDIFRASGLALLGTGNTHVQKDRKRIQSGHAFFFCYHYLTVSPFAFSSNFMSCVSPT